MIADAAFRTALTRLATLALLPVALAATACGGTGLKLTLIDSSAKRPSNVAMYFTVDTSDGEPVAGLQADSFRIYEDGRLVSVHESKQTILNPEIAAAHYTILLVDMSGSVTESGDVPAIVDAASSFAERVGHYQKVAVYAFDGRTDIVKLVSFTNSPDAIRRGLGKLNSFKSRDPSTNLNGAIINAHRALDKKIARTREPLRFGTLVIFTDGTDRAARVSRETLYELVEQSEYDLFVIGVGAEIDEEELSAIGKSGTVMTKNRAEIADAFSQAAARIEAFSQRYYLLGYCSPARAQVHKVRVEAVHDGRSGSVSYEFDAKGFGPKCNPEAKPSFNVRRPRPAATTDH